MSSIRPKLIGLSRLSIGILVAPLVTSFPTLPMPEPDSAYYVNDLHAEICSKITMSDDNYKLSAKNVRCIDLSFAVGDFVMVHIQQNDCLNTPKKSSTPSYVSLQDRPKSWDLMDMCLIYLTTWVLVIFSMWRI